MYLFSLLINLMCPFLSEYILLSLKKKKNHNNPRLLKQYAFVFWVKLQITMFEDGNNVRKFNFPKSHLSENGVNFLSF